LQRMLPTQSELGYLTGAMPDPQRSGKLVGPDDAG